MGSKKRTANEAWKRIEHWLSANAPEILSSLNDPATPEALWKLADAVGQSLPEEMSTVYRVHDGQDDESGAGGLLPNGYDYGDMAHGLAELERFISDHEMMTKLIEMGDFSDIQKQPNPAIKTAPWNKLWIPIANDGGGDYHCIDLDPGSDGMRGQVITVGESETQTVVASSLSDWLSQIADEMEAGQLKVNEDYGLVRWD